MRIWFVSLFGALVVSSAMSEERCACGPSDWKGNCEAGIEIGQSWARVTSSTLTCSRVDWYLGEMAHTTIVTDGVVTMAIPKQDAPKEVVVQSCKICRDELLGDGTMASEVVPQQVKSLQPGLYELTTSNTRGLDLDQEYEITHGKILFEYEGTVVVLNVGIGWGAFNVPFGVYFDYDQDRQVDTDMARRFIREIPVAGSLLEKRFDPEVSQALYENFLAESDEATFKSVEEMASDAEESSSVVWQFVLSQYETIKEWLAEQLTLSQTEAPGR